jgi:hypothetical protein
MGGELWVVRKTEERIQNPEEIEHRTFNIERDRTRMTRMQWIGTDKKRILDFMIL